jgi:Tfp pilus assembly protein PilP
LRYVACLLILTACSSECSVALKHWTPEEQRQMADEIADLPDDSLLIPAMNDYAKLRREVK